MYVKINMKDLIKKILKEGLRGIDQENIPYTDRTYYHGIYGNRLKKFKKTGGIPEAEQAFGGLFSITDDYDLVKNYSGDGIILVIKVDGDTIFEYGDPFDEDYFPEGDITDIGESEFIVNNPNKINIVDTI